MFLRTRSTATSLLTPILLLSVCLFPPVALAGKAEQLAGHWTGEINIPSLKLTINIDFRAADGGWEGDISIPAQGASDLPLGDVVLKDGAVSFEIPGIPGKPTFNGTLAEDGQRISGEFTLKELSIISVCFAMDEEGRVTGVLVNQPQGVFEAKKK